MSQQHPSSECRGTCPPANAADISGATRPIWYADSSAPSPMMASGSLSVDAVVVGAGIAGLTTAYLLAKAGKSVIVVDEKPIGGGETGRTSAHLASALDDRFEHIEKIHGTDNCRLHYESHATAIDLIEQITRDEGINCDFARVDGWLVRDASHDREYIDVEHKAAVRAGVQGVELLESTPGLGIPGPCIRFPRQARFHPLHYLFGLSGACEKLGVRFVRDRVTDLSGDGPVTAKLKSGGDITAQAGVAATNVPTPINDWMWIYTKQSSYRSYVIALDIGPATFPDILLWDTADPYRYVRAHETGGKRLLIIGGEDHKVGQTPEDNHDAFDALEAWARQHFSGLGARVSHWSGQVAEPDDGIAFIGRAPTGGHKACYVITGDSGMGLTHATLGARLVTDLILERSNPWEKLYATDRKALKSAPTFVSENVNTVAQFADYVKPSQYASESDIPKCCGGVMRDGLKKVAVYRDEHGQLHKRSAICPHLKCVVRWNDVEASWDCPCHGSRFDAFGKLIIGPAIDDLPPVE